MAIETIPTYSVYLPVGLLGGTPNDAASIRDCIAGLAEMILITHLERPVSLGVMDSAIIIVTFELKEGADKLKQLCSSDAALLFAILNAVGDAFGPMAEKTPPDFPF